MFSEEIFEFYDPTTRCGKERAYYSTAKFHIEKIVFCVNPFKPLFRDQWFYRFGRRVEHPWGKAVLRALATYFCNVIHGMETHLRRL